MNFSSKGSTVAYMTEIVQGTYWHPGWFVGRLINGIVGIIEVILLVRLVLELFGANPSSPFVAWAYNLSAVFIGPFAGAFPGIYLTPNSLLDIVAIVAMVGYALIGWLIIELIAFIFSAMRGI
jgi:YggT family protein